MACEDAELFLRQHRDVTISLVHIADASEKRVEMQ